jgi:hypothetical protein
MTIKIPSCLKTIEKSPRIVSESILGGTNMPFAVFLRAAKEYFKKTIQMNILTKNPKKDGLEKKTEAMLRTTINTSGRG